MCITRTTDSSERERLIDEKELQKTIESFLENPFWAEYYDAAPSGAKEIIALGFYMSSSEMAHNDPEAQSVLESVQVPQRGNELAELSVGGPAFEVDDLEDITRAGLVEDGSRSFYIDMLD